MFRIFKNTVEYFDIIGALCADNGNGEYPGLLRTGCVLYNFVYAMRCYAKKEPTAIVLNKGVTMKSVQS